MASFLRDAASRLLRMRGIQTILRPRAHCAVGRWPPVSRAGRRVEKNVFPRSRGVKPPESGKVKESRERLLLYLHQGIVIAGVSGIREISATRRGRLKHARHSTLHGVVFAILCLARPATHHALVAAGFLLVRRTPYIRTCLLSPSLRDPAPCPSPAAVFLECSPAPRRPWACRQSGCPA